MSGLDGKKLAHIAERTYGRKEVTKDELAYLLTMLNPSSYLLRNHRVKNHPITFHISGHNTDKSFSHRPWQVGIINDQHPDKAVIKSRQLGLSEIGVAEMIHFADVNSFAGVKCLYTFPTNRQMEDFVSTRLNPVFEKGYYNTIIHPSENSLKRKRIRDSIMFFRSASKGSAVEGVDIDYLSLDEYDRVSPSAEISALSSMDSSQYKVTRRWSTPTIPNYGIHALYEKSDQKVYMHKCDSCNEWQQLDYEKNIECIDPNGVDLLAQTVKEGTFRYICQKCGSPLDRWYNGEWVAKYPERVKNGGTSGYLISQMNAVWVPADKLKRDEMAAKSKQQFYNYKLGLPYQDVALAVQNDDVLDNGREDLPEPMTTRGNYRFISVGIDWGNFHWVVVRGFRDDGRNDIIGLKAVERSRGTANIEQDLHDVINYVQSFDPDIICADLGDSGNYVYKLMDHFGRGKVYGVKVNSNPRSTGMIEPTWNENRGIVTIDKLTQNKIHISDLKMQRYGFYNQQDQLLNLYIDHWKNVVIRDEEDEKTGEVYQIITDKGDDHFAQSSVYSQVGLIHVLEPFMPGNEMNAFNYTSVTDLQPQQTDIFSRGH